MIRKEVETRQVNQPVELTKETVQVERLTPEQAKARGISTTEGSQQISKDQVFIAVTREEVVVQKQVQPREVVRAETASQTERQNVDATLRREVARVETQGTSAQGSLDERIRNELRANQDLRLDERQISLINVRSDQGTVTLSGRVTNDQLAAQIERRVRQIPGVQ